MPKFLTVEETVHKFIPDATKECIQDVIANASRISPRFKRPIISKKEIFDYLRKKYNLPVAHYARGQKNYWILRGYSDEEAERLYHQYSKKFYSRGVEFYMGKGLTEEEAKERIKQTVSKQQETISQWSDEKRQAVTASKANDLEAYIRRHGEEEGKRRYYERIEKYKYAVSLEGMTERYGEDEAKRLIEERNKSCSSNLEACIRRYGEEEGRRRYEETCQKKAFAQTLEGYIERYGKEEGTLRFEERQRKYVESCRNKPLEELIRIAQARKVPFASASKSSLMVFEPLHQWLLDQGINDREIFYGKDSRREYFLWADNNELYWYDFAISGLKLLIEFNGTHFHAKSPNQTDFRNPYEPHLTAQEVWEHDQYKLDTARKRGYNVFVIWDDVLPEENLRFLKTEITKLLEEKAREKDNHDL